MKKTTTVEIKYAIISYMKIDFIKLVLFIWMFFIGYFIYEMYIDLNYMTDLFHAYVKMAVEIAKH
jgi:hypothetical protein